MTGKSASGEKPFDRALGRKARVFERFQAVQADDGGALVVRRAAAVDLSVRDLSAERIVRPPAAGGHYVEVAEDGKGFSAAENHFADIVVVVVRFESEALRQTQKVVESPCGALAEGFTGQGGALRAVDLYDLRNAANACVKISFDVRLHDDRLDPPILLI